MVTRAKKRTVRSYQGRLNILLDLAQSINEELSIEQLLSHFENVLIDKLDVSKVLLITLYKGRSEKILVSGLDDSDQCDIDIVKDLSKYTEIEAINTSHPKSLQGFDSIIPLFHKHEPYGFVLIGDADDDIEGISPTIKHLKLIQIIANIIVVFIENKKMQDKILRQESIRKEMELASKIQSQLLPVKSELPQSNGYEIDVFYRPHFEIGGDYYDCIKLSDHELGFCIADVSGKGIPASLVMANFQAHFRASFTGDIKCERLTDELNARVNSSAHGEKFITMFLGKYDTNTRVLTYINSGHLPPLVFDPEKKELIELHKGCIALGMLDQIPSYEVGELKMPKNAHFIAFTDGVVELRDTENVMLGIKSIQDIMIQDISPDEKLAQVKGLIEDNVAKNIVFDDSTILNIVFK